MFGLVVYASKYGSTAEYASLIAKKLGTGALRASEAPSEAVSGAGFIVLGSPIYAYSVLPEMESFLEENREILAGKPLAAFVVCGDTLWNPRAGEGGDRNLRKLTDHLPSEPFAAVVLGGRMRLEDLDETDGPRILAFYERIGREPTGFDRTEPAAASAFAEEIRRYLAGGRGVEPGQGPAASVSRKARIPGRQDAGGDTRRRSAGRERGAMTNDPEKILEQEALHFAAQDGDLLAVEQLIATGYPPDRFDELGKTPLHYAAENGHADAMRLLLEAGADVDAHDPSVAGNTPLGDASGSCSFEVAKLLIDAGADPTIPGWMGLTALDRAEKRKKPEGRKVHQLLLAAAERG